MMQEEHFEEFATLIGGIYGDIQKIKSAYTQTLGLKAVHMFWLYLLRVHPEGLSASELAAAGKTNRSLVSREIDELVNLGAVEAAGQTGRRRYGWKFTLTQSGRDLAEEIAQVSRQVQNTVSREISEGDLRVFYRTLNTLSHNFELLASQPSKGANHEDNHHL